MDGCENDKLKSKSDVIFKKMSSAGVKKQNSWHLQSNSMDNLCEGDGDSLEAVSNNENNLSVDNISIETASINTNCFQDNSSIDNSSTNISMDIREVSDSTLNLQEITQSILDLEGTQTSRDRSEYGIHTELQRITQVPSSPPPSYEHVLAETRLAQQVAFATGEQNADTDDANKPATTAGNPGSTTTAAPKKGIEIMHKSHKEFYRAVAKQCGITCKMSDHCRCLDCQSMYFECEYDYNEQEKTDGGLGAGTPMFISEVMHGSACTLI